jgi:hypothetical protein
MEEYKLKPYQQKEFTTLNFRKAGVLLGILAGCGLLGTSLPAQSELAISGQLSYNVADRDSEDDLVFQRNGFSETQFRLVYSRPLENEMNLEVVEEIGFNEGEDSLRSRRQEVILKGNFGGVRFGQGNDAGDGNLNGDFSGTTVIQPIASQAAAFDYSGANYNGFDPGRGERIRYDSPKLGDAAVISFQIGEEDETEIAVRYNTEIGGGKLRVGAFLTNTGSDVDEDSSGILVAYGMDNGLNFAVVGSSKDNAAGTEDGDFIAIKIGFITGMHAFSFISGTSENPGNPVETDSIGIAYVYTMDKGIELFAATNEFDSDDSAADEDFFIAGTRVKF